MNMKATDEELEKLDMLLRKYAEQFDDYFPLFPTMSYQEAINRLEESLNTGKTYEINYMKSADY